MTSKKRGGKSINSGENAEVLELNTSVCINVNECGCDQ
jgi:hypothetical protein